MVFRGVSYSAENLLVPASKLHSERFKNTQGWKLKFVGLYISDKKPFRDHFLEVFYKFQNSFKKFG